MRCVNEGVGFINYRGHGDADKWSSCNGMQNSDIPALKMIRSYHMCLVLPV